ncbi:MAG TPA: ABC transporter substrate-binding protein [Candidatus Hydrogenedentes bacterium]|nr:ABC transporter substrate-binding protein [Candidatus Hydrogenedentota bacterium]HQM48076.1 ABC transporter substrate-binding protein [Candidatus Hydrogenedentota bacterium]
MNRRAPLAGVLAVAIAAAMCPGRFAAAAYQEAPVLRALVERGQLPTVAERLPEHPMIVKPIEKIGQYGGTWRRFSLGNRDLLLNTRMGYEPLVRWDLDGKTVVPNLAHRWEVLDNGCTYVFHLRKGVKWSDGQPLTSEDIDFVMNDFYANTDLSPIYPSWLTINGNRVSFSAPDPCTVVFRFPEPYSIFLEMMAYNGNLIVLPKHYLKQFHAKYQDPDELQRLIAKASLNRWFELFHRMADPNQNPACPTYRPFQLVTELPAQRMVARRNPYYWKVDPEGNQLPYIDEVAYTDVQNNEIVTMKAMAGETDFQARRIDASNYALFMENRKRGNYHVMRDMSPGTEVLYVNPHSKNEEIRPFLAQRDFRIALSLAINRAEINFILFSGTAVPSRGIASPYDPYYLPEFDEKYLDYDPRRAEELLDGVGLKRGPSGMRCLPDGKRFRQIIYIFATEIGTPVEMWQLVADYFREVGLDFVVQVDAVALSPMRMWNGNTDFWAYSTAGIHWVLDPVWFVPCRSASYFAPLYGRYIASNGKDKMGVKPPEEYQRIYDWYQELLGATDEQERLELGHNILRQWSEQCYTVGICRQELLTIVRNEFKNVPATIIHDYRVLTPGYIGIEQFYIEQGEQETK